MFGFGKKTDAKKPAEPTPAPAATTGAAATGPAAATAPSGGDMFGGMQARSRRKKGGADPMPDDPVVAEPVKAAEPEPPKEVVAKPFFSNFNFAATGGGAVDMSAYEDDPETARIKRRLERFYSYYNPSKLTSLDETIKRFAGREDELFTALEQKYGPEPKDTAPVSGQAKQAAGQAPKRSKSAADESVPSNASDAAPDSFGAVPAQFGSDSAGFGAAPPADFGDGGFGTASGGGFGDGGFGGAGDGGFGGGDAGFGAGFGSATEGFGTAAGAGFETAAGFGGGGFGGGDFGEPTATAFGFGGDAGGGFGTETTAFGFSAAPDAAASAPAFGFTDGFDSSTAAAPAATDAFGTFSTTATTVAGADQSSAPPASSQPQGRATAVASASASDSDSESEDGGRYGMVERINAVIDTSRLAVSSARAQGASCLLAEAATRRQRRQLVAEYARLEGELDRLTAAEEYEAADEVNTKLGSIAGQIDSLDARPPSDIKDAVLERVSKALSALAGEYQSQRSVLHEARAEEERRTMNYLAESRTKLEQVGDAVRADLEKATRLLKNTQQEVDNLADRRKKIEDKIQDQTKELRAERDKVAGQASKLEEEIKELEKTLALKRRTLTERKVTLQDMDHQLGLITDAHRESISGITSQQQEESQRLQSALQRVEQLSVQQQANERATSELQEESDGMLRSLEEHASKIKRFEQNAAIIQQSMLDEYAQFFARTLGNVFAGRASGLSCLCAAPHRADSAGSAQLAALQAKLSNVEAEVKSELEAEGRETTRAQELANLIPVLEAAKKAAAGAKQFKEAAAKTEEIKRATDDRATALSSAESHRVRAVDLEKAARQLRKEKESEAAAYRSKIRTFTDAYGQLLRDALVAIDVASLQNTASLTYIDSLPLFEGGKFRSDAEGIQSDSAVDDPLVSSAREYIMSLFEELAGVLDVSVQSLLVASDPPESPTKPQSTNPSSPQEGSPTNGAAGSTDPASGAAGFDDFGTSDAAAAFGDGFGDATAGEGFGDQTGFDTVCDPYAAMTVDELRQLLEEKQQAQESALADERYDDCEELQQAITSLESAISHRSF